MNENRVSSLINTSVEDMQSGLWGYGVDDLEMLRLAQQVVEKRGEKTKAKILSAKIRKLEKSIVEAQDGSAPITCGLGGDMRG